MFVRSFTLVIQSCRTNQRYKFDRVLHVGSTFRTEGMITSTLNEQPTCISWLKSKYQLARPNFMVR